MLNWKKTRIKICNIIFLITSISSFAGSQAELRPLAKNEFSIQIGGFSKVLEKSRTIFLQGNLVGNQYIDNSVSTFKGLIGLSYMLEGPNLGYHSIKYGIDAFYLGRTSSNGYIVQEHQFTNLNYHYRIRNIPIFLAVKTVMNTPHDKIKLAVDLGVGPNFMRVSNYYEEALNDYTIPDNAFSAQNNVTFSTTVGASVRFQHSIELGYRFFYLGQGQFNKKNEQVISTLNTGNVYANAFVFTIVI